MKNVIKFLLLSLALFVGLSVKAQNQPFPDGDLTNASPKAGIIYVNSTGNDSNSGLSWAQAKFTIYNAICSLPNGNCRTRTAGSGTIYVAPNSSMNSTSNAGIWLMGPHDPNYASPPAGWLKSSSAVISIIGVPNASNGTNAHLPRTPVTGGSGSDTHHPAIDISSWQWPLHIENLAFQYPGRAIVLGECSNFTNRTGTCQDSSIYLSNVAGAINQVAGMGPCADITGASFWIWLSDLSCNGNPNATGGYTANQGAAVLIDGGTNYGPGLIYIDNANTSSGGVKAIKGYNGISVYVNRLTEEGGGQRCPPAVWFTNFDSDSDAIINNALVADCTGGIGVENDGAGPWGPTVWNTYGPVVGPSTSINPELPPGTVMNHSPLSQRQSGIFHNYLIGQTNVARRLGGLVGTRVANAASSNPSGWGAAYGSSGIRVTTGLTDPFGGSGAASVTTSSGSQTLSFNGTSYPSWSGSVGDWVVGGVWVKNASNNGALSISSCPTGSSVLYSTTITNSGELVNNSSGIVDSWEFVWVAGKVGTTGAHACLTIATTSAATPIFYGPNLFFIPKSVMTDNEVMEFVTAMNSVDSSCPTGDICNVAGHPVYTKDTLTVPAILPQTLYSAAGTPLPTCNSKIKGQQAVVSDATSPTYMGAYSSGGAVIAPVICSYNGSTYSWLTH